MCFACSFFQQVAGERFSFPKWLFCHSERAKLMIAAGKVVMTGKSVHAWNIVNETFRHCVWKRLSSILHRNPVLKHSSITSRWAYGQKVLGLSSGYSPCYLLVSPAIKTWTRFNRSSMRALLQEQVIASNIVGCIAKILEDTLSIVGVHLVILTCGHKTWRSKSNYVRTKVSTTTTSYRSGEHLTARKHPPRSPMVIPSWRNGTVAFCGNGAGGSHTINKSASRDSKIYAISMFKLYLKTLWSLLPPLFSAVSLSIFINSGEKSRLLYMWCRK